MKLEYAVTEENRLSLCDEIAEIAESFCRQYLKDGQDVVRYKMTVEECLLGWLTPEAVGQTLVFVCRKRPLCKPVMELQYSGSPSNPFASTQARELGEYGRSILKNLGLSPTYTYRDERNVLRFELANQGKSSIRQLLSVIAASVLVGWLGTVLIPENYLNTIQTNVIRPIYNTFFDILGCIAGPMIFLSVAWGVYGIGDAATLSRVGKRMLGGFLGTDFLVGACCLITFPVFCLTITADTAGSSQLGKIFEMILDFFPSNIFEPFENGNTLQIIFLGFAVGFALLFLGKRTESVARAVEQVNYLIQFFMEAIGKLVPYVVFAVIVSLSWSGTLNLLVSTWKLFAVMLGMIFVVCVGFYTLTALRYHVSLPLLVKKCLPSFLIALTTASSAATFNSNMEICDRKLGVRRTVSSFGVPLAMVLHNPIAVINNVVIAFFFASCYDLEVSRMWLLTAVLVGAVLAIATPPIPGGGTMAYTMLFLQLGIPEDALGMVLALDMLTDFFITAAEMFCLLPAMVNVSARIGALDEKILRAKQ